MNKKYLLSLTVILIMILSMVPALSIKAAENTGIRRTSFQTNYIDSSTISVAIELQPTKKMFTKKELISIVEEKYNNSGIVESIKLNNNDITNDVSKVGTNADINLNSGEKIKVVLFCDTNCDGKIDNKDVYAAASHYYNKDILTGAAFKAGNVVITGQNGDKQINNYDVFHILDIHLHPEKITGDVVQAPLFPIDNYKTTLNPTIISVGDKENDSAVKSYSRNLDNIIIKADIDSMSAQTISKTANGTINLVPKTSQTAKTDLWYSVIVDVGISDFKIDNSSEFYYEVDENTPNKVTVYLRADVQSTSVTITNNKNSAETVTLNFSTTKVVMPKITGAKNIETEKTGNQIYVAGVTPTPVAGQETTSVSVTANPDAMSNISGIKAYSVVFTSDMPGTEICAVEVNETGKIERQFNVVDVKTLSNGKYEVSAILDGAKSTDNILFINKSQASDRILTKNKITVTITKKLGQFAEDSSYRSSVKWKYLY